MLQQEKLIINVTSVSVVIPCYNVADYVRSAVESALNQTLPPQEVICVDDGSTDDTFDILRGLKESGADILIRSQENCGATAARNVGLDICNAEYVCFLDADDILHPEKLEHQTRLVTESLPRPDLIVGAAKNIFVDDPEKPERVDVPHTDKWIGLITSSLGITSSNLWKRSAVQAVGGWNENAERSQDTDLTFRMLRNGATVLRDPEVLTTLRRRNDSLWKQDPAASRKAFLKLRCQIKSYLEATGQLTEDRVEALASSFSMIRKVHSDGSPQLARRMHAELIPNDYHPDVGRTYDAVYSVLGFHAAEAFHGWYTLLRQHVFPSR